MRRVGLLALLLASASCAPKNPFLGRWDTEVTLSGNRIPLEVAFAEQGVARANFELAGVKAMLAGTYTFQGRDRLNIVFRTLDLDTAGSLLPKSMIEQGKASIEKELKQPQGGTVAWASDSVFTATPDRAGAPTLKFTRRSE